MPVGASVFCLALGAILTFAVETDSTEGIDVNNVGIILMIAGAIGLAVYAMIWAPRRRVIAQPIVEHQVVQQPAFRQRVVAQPVAPVATSQPVVERRVYG